MPRESAANETASGRVSGVSTKILELLSAGSKSTAALVEEGGFSAGAAFLNLKKLKDAGTVITERDGRVVNYSLAEGASLPESAPRRGRKKGARNTLSAKPARQSKKSKSGLSAAPQSLAAELLAISERLTPIPDLNRKLEVLDNLVGNMPASVSKVLQSIRDELVRRS